MGNFTLYKLVFFLSVLLCLSSCSEDSSAVKGTDEDFKEEPAAEDSSSAKGTQDDPNVDVLLDSYNLLAGAEDVQNILGNDHFKLVFRNENKGNLVVMEYDDDSLAVRKLDLGTDLYHPTFSPDGSKIAFCTWFEGAPMRSDLYVFDLKTEKLDTLKVKSAGIPRWYVLPQGDTTIVYLDFLGSDMSDEWQESSTWQVTYQNGKFGKPHKIFNRSYNGGVSYDYSFAATGAPRLRYHFARDDDSLNSLYYNGEQVCNVSISRDSSVVISFLETAGSLGKEYTHENYAWHYYVFYQDTLGQILKAIPALEKTVFDHVEWINVPHLQVGIVSDTLFEYNRIAVIDYELSKVTLLLEAKAKITMWHPDLWVDPVR